MNKTLKKITLALCAVVSAATMAFAVSCSDGGTNNVDPDAGTNTNTNTNTDNNGNTDNSGNDNNQTVDYAIVFDGASATSNYASGVTVSAGTVTITAAGTYTVKGTATDGNIIVSVAKTEKVTLVLSGVDITSTTTAPIFVASADKVHIVLADGTTNTLTDPAEYVYEGTETKPNACLYSKDDIEIEGSGKLVVNANFNNGIGCKNDIKITGGTIVVSAENNAIKGNDSVQISGGAITITKCDDGIKTDNETEENKGYITIEDCTISITASDDGIVCNRLLTIKSTAKITYNVKGKPYSSDAGTTDVAVE